ncbi:MAG: GNAT family N-acetyltransferase [Bacilli bacterium]
MDIIINENIRSETIYFLRKRMISDTFEVKQYLGVNSSNLRSILPIKNREFNIWVFRERLNIVGFLTFKDNKDDVKFLKEFYVLPEHRNKGYGKQMLLSLYSQHHKIECKINTGNERMYRLAKIINLRGEKSIVFRWMKNIDIRPILWSNFKENGDYV